jgi:hypothetical protein
VFDITGRSNSAFTTLKIALLAPIPGARVSVATSVKPGVFASARAAYRKSCPSIAMDSPPALSNFSAVRALQFGLFVTRRGER